MREVAAAGSTAEVTYIMATCVSVNLFATVAITVMHYYPYRMVRVALPSGWRRLIHLYQYVRIDDDCVTSGDTFLNVKSTGDTLTLDVDTFQCQLKFD